MRGLTTVEQTHIYPSTSLTNAVPVYIFPPPHFPHPLPFPSSSSPSPPLFLDQKSSKDEWTYLRSIGRMVSGAVHDRAGAKRHAVRRHCSTRYKTRYDQQQLLHKPKYHPLYFISSLK